MAGRPVVRFAAEEQAALEAKAAARWERVGRGELSPEAGMGAIEEWTMEIGGNRLALVPSTSEWLYYDPVHDTWEPTGYTAGTVRFGVGPDGLGVKHLARFCGNCGAPGDGRDRFCGACGSERS
jgi:hypothetical protein